MSVYSALDERELSVMQAEHYQIDESSQLNSMDEPMVTCVGTVKRPRNEEECEEEENESQWTTVSKRKDKRYKSSDIIEIYISCNEKLPKQFGFARLLKQHGITEVVKVKYVNPYKIRMDFNNELMANKIETCNELIEKGWKFHRAMEQSHSYGVLKNVDLELSDEDIFDSITCSNPAKLVSVSRLQRRSDGKWVPSEAVRLCFKVTFLPSYVYADGLKIKVEPYIFPVSQCWRCWQLGHTVRKCPKNKVICPKCSGNHENCDTEILKCVNCSGSHISMSKICPKYKKEKRLRELMAEFNCTYRKSMEMYVEPETPEQENKETTDTHDEPRSSGDTVEHSFPLGQRSFAEVLRKKPQSESTERTPQRATKKQKQRSENQPNNREDTFNFSYETPPPFERDIPGTSSQDKPIKFSELLTRLKEILFLREVSFKNKLLNILRCCIRWLIEVVASNFADSSCLNLILGFFNAG